MRRDSWGALVVVVLLTILGPARADDDAGCDLGFGGSYREAVKLRTPADAHGYMRKGPMPVGSFFALICPFDALQARTRIGDTTPPLSGLETIEATVEGYLMVARRDPKDNDLHVQLGATPKWGTGQLIVEIPATPAFCEVRTRVHDLVRRDHKRFGGNDIGKGHILRVRPHVRVTGYVFLDATHGRQDTCHANGGRGIKAPGQQESPVRGLWELHPATNLEIIDPTHAAHDPTRNNTPRLSRWERAGGPPHESGPR